MNTLCEQQPRRALIIQPGAIGDCILTLPLARLLRQQTGITQVDMMGRQSTLNLFPGRTAIDSIISLDKVSLHPLFADCHSFDLPDGDPLISLFRGYEMIITFLGDDQGHFQQNLLYTTFMSNPAEIVKLSLRPPADWPSHVCQFYLQQLIDELSLYKLRMTPSLLEPPLIQINDADQRQIEYLLTSKGLAINTLEDTIPEKPNNLVIIHPGSGGLSKCWNINNFLELAARLAQNGCQILWLLGPAEIERFKPDIIQKIESNGILLKDLSLEQIPALLYAATVYIGNDSGISHLAGALNIPTIAIFGQTPDYKLPQPHHWKPLGKNTTIGQTPSSPQLWPSVDDIFKLCG